MAHLFSGPISAKLGRGITMYCIPKVVPNQHVSSIGQLTVELGPLRAKLFGVRIPVQVALVLLAL